MKKILLFFGLLLCYNSALAWNARGHMIVAAISWDNLDAASQKKVTEILMLHPDYEERWKNEFEEKWKNDLALGKFLIMRASTWPDDIKSSKNPLHKYDRREWHYITYRVIFPNNHDSSIPVDEDKKGNIVFAIDHARNMVADVHTPDDQRAIYLSWVIHLIGDVHQPLHCGSLFNDNFVKGDGGGNKFYIRPNTAGIKLHKYWDGLLGSRRNFRTASNKAFQIASEQQKENVLSSEKPNAEPAKEDTREWSLISLDEAVVHAYLNGRLKYGLTKEMATEIPSDYGKKSKALAEIKVAIAGYRLANNIERILWLK